MSAVPTGTPEAITWAGGTNPAAQDITVPTDCTMVAMGWSFFNTTAGHGLASATLNGVAADLLYEIPTGGTDLTGTGVAIWFNPPTGTQALQTVWDSTAQEGQTCIVAYTKDGDTSALRDVDAAQASVGTAVSVTLTTAVGDTVFKYDQKYGATAPSLTSGWTNVLTQTVNQESARLSYIVATDVTTVAASEDEDYSSIVAWAVIEGITYALDLAAFAFGNDDGNESSHTIGTQNSNYSGALATKTLRFLINATDDPPAVALTLRFQKNGTGGYLPVPTSSGTSPALSWGAAGTIAYSTSGGTSVAPTYPSGITTSSVLVLVVGQKPTTANGGTVTTPSGWTLQGSLTGANDGDTGGYTTTLGADTGNTNIYVYTKDTVAGTETGTLSVTVADNGVCWANIYRVQASDVATLSYAIGTGKDTAAGSVSIATGSMAIAAGDFIIGGMVIPTDVTTPAQFSAEALSQTGTTFGTVAEIEEPDSTTGNDIGGFLIYAPVSSGSGSGAVTLTATAGGTTTNVRGPGFVLRIRATSVVNEVYLSASANVAAAAADATTSRLTGGSGSYVAGRRSDDTNPLPTIDMSSGGNTETEYVLTTQSPAVNGDYFEFREYVGSTPFASYTNTARWTISTGGGAPGLTLPQRYERPNVLLRL